MDRWKAEQGRGREKRKIRREKIRRERVRRQKIQLRGKGRKVAKHCVFPMICGSGESKSRIAKAAACGASWPQERWKIARRCGAKHISKSKCAKLQGFGSLLEVAMSKKCTPLWREAHFESKCTKHLSIGPLLEVAMSKKCTPLWREAHFEVKMYKTPQRRTTFGSCDVEKVHAVVARSTFRSQNVQNTPCSRPLLEVRMLKKCTPSWREAHFEVKMSKTPHVRATFGGSDVASLHYTTLHYITLHSTTLRSTTLHYITHNTTTTTTQLHSTTLHYTKLHYTTTTLHYTTLHYTTLHYTTLHYLPLHFTTLHYTPLHYNYNYNYTTTLHYNTLHYTPLH